MLVIWRDPHFTDISTPTSPLEPLPPPKTHLPSLYSIFFPLCFVEAETPFRRVRDGSKHDDSYFLTKDYFRKYTFTFQEYPLLFCCFYYRRIKKGGGQGKYVTFSTMMHKEVSESFEMTTHHVPLRQMID